ncbi:MAG TPA: type II secretion system F family protein [Acidimicrobiia bacterium]|nr:type II secretion system F family protein [Acidimicrobiia bacterium]
MSGGGPLRRPRLAAVVRAAVGRRRADAALVAGLPEVLDRVADGLRAGAAPLAALAEAGGAGGVPERLGADLARVVERAAAGGLGPALAAWAEERPLPPVAAAAAALRVTVDAGGPGAAALEGLAAALRDRADAAAEVAALSAQARLSAVVVGAAPVASLALSLVADRRVAPTLVTTGPGRACLAAGLGLEGLAAVWMRRIVRCGP